MVDLVKISFQMISQTGHARSKFIESYRFAKDNEFEKAKQAMKEGDEAFIKGHTIHAELIQQEAQGNNTCPSLLLLHAEDQLMSAEIVKLMALEIIDIYASLRDLKKKVEEL